MNANTVCIQHTIEEQVLNASSLCSENYYTSALTNICATKKTNER